MDARTLFNGHSPGKTGFASSSLILMQAVLKQEVLTSWMPNQQHQSTEG